MRTHWTAAWLGTAALFVVCQGIRSEPPHADGKEGGEVAVFRPTEVRWQPGPPSLPKGAQVAVLEGDPAKEGPFVLRVKMPDGYRIAPHTHPKTERLTVVSGLFYIAMGDRFDEGKGQAMPAGTFGRWPAGMQHFAWVKGETVIQLHGIGPWSIQYVNPADDPRNKDK